MDGLRYNEFSPMKIWTQADKLKMLARGEDVCPSTLELDVCSHCNHKCSWCVDPKGSHDNVFMDVAVAQAIITDAFEMGIRGLVFKGGGEPSLHPEFEQILKAAKMIGFEIGVVTNGTNLERLSAAYLETLAYIRISTDGATPTTRLKTHGIDDFDELRDSIKRFTVKRTGRHPVIGLSFCMEYEDINEIPLAITMGEKAGVDYTLLRPVFGEEVGYTPTHSPKEAALLRKEIAKHAAIHTGKMLVMAGNWKGDKEFESSKPNINISAMVRRDMLVQENHSNGIEHQTHRCLAAGLLLVITANLDVYFCCCTRGLPQFKMGNLTDFTLRDFWEAGKFKPQLERLKRCECLPFCTHPMEKYNRIIEYLSLEHKHHANFI
ncbi:MAG: radical SAM protein [Defluviitaleaceae bacterium]|nr:radical SAM protein [Defluviitaleaceae bacterium]